MPVLKCGQRDCTLPKPPEFQTVYISGGKKNKLNKIDIVGFFSQKGKLEKGDLGLIEVKDFVSFAAVKAKKVKDLLQCYSRRKDERKEIQNRSGSKGDKESGGVVFFKFTYAF
jgi:ATP-dependent RNA helicase DeaD